MINSFQENAEAALKCFGLCRICEQAEEIDNLFNVPAVSEARTQVSQVPVEAERTATLTWQEHEAPFSSSLWDDSTGGDAAGAHCLCLSTSTPSAMSVRLDLLARHAPGNSDMLQQCLYSSVVIMSQGGQSTPKDSVDRIDPSLPGLPGPLHPVPDKYTTLG